MILSLLVLLGTLGAEASAGPTSTPPPPTVASLREALDTGDYEGAVHLGERLTHAEPRSSEAQDLLGRAYGRRAEESGAVSQMRLAKKARAAFARAVALDPGNAAALANLGTYDLRAPEFLGGSRDRARTEAQELLRLDPARGHELLGAIAEKDKDLASAESQYRLALSSAKDSNRSRQSLSDFLVRRKRFSEARALWRPPDAGGPSDPVCGYALAGIALDSGQQLQAASADLQRALRGESDREEPRRGPMLFRLGELDERLGRRDEARARIQEALSLEPKRKAWQKKLARLSP